jgi:hypothetical protein
VKNIPEPGYLGAIPALPLLSYMTVWDTQIVCASVSHLWNGNNSTFLIGLFWGLHKSICQVLSLMPCSQK